MRMFVEHLEKIMKKHKAYFIFIVILLIIAAVTAGIFVYNKKFVVCFGNECFKVKVADERAERERGLMFVFALGKNEGMLFVFDSEGRYGFWMKNTLIPLDMIWIDESGEIVFIKENALPCSSNECETYVPDNDALYVLEVNSGAVDEFGLKAGDNAEIRL